MTTRTLSDILRGTVAGDMQTVGVMQVIPLLGRATNNAVALVSDVRVSNTNYGHMKFNNQADLPAIVPQHAGYLTNYKAQDHATPVAVMVNKVAELNTAMCIESSRGGQMRGDGTEELIIMPFQLRETAFNTRNINGYSKLWKEIANFSKRLGSSVGGHINRFLDAFRDQVEHFVAEFELLDNQVGAVILINGHLVGVERYASAVHFAEVWETIIRDCYGTLAQEVAEVERIRAVDTRVELGEGFTNLDDIIDGLLQADATEREAVSSLLRSVMNEPLVVVAEGEHSVIGWRLETYKNDHFVGQAITSGSDVLYASIIATQYRRSREPNEVLALAV